MLITLNIMSSIKGEISNFFMDVFNEKLEENIYEWIYVYRDSSAAVSMIGSVLEVQKKYKLSLWVKINDEDLVQITNRNKTRFISNIAKKLLKNTG